MTSVLIGRREELKKRETQREDNVNTRGERQCTIKAETGIMYLQTKVVRNSRSWEKGTQQFLLETLERDPSSAILIRNFQHQKCGRIHLLCFKPFSLWWFVISAIGNECDKHKFWYDNSTQISFKISYNLICLNHWDNVHVSHIINQPICWIDTCLKPDESLLDNQTQLWDDEDKNKVALSTEVVEAAHWSKSRGKIMRLCHKREKKKTALFLI